MPREHLAALFTTPHIHPLDGTTDLPDRLIVGVAPGGDVAVWAAGPGGTMNIGLWQAQAIELSMAEMVGETEMTHDEFAEMLLEENLSEEARKNAGHGGARAGTVAGAGPAVQLGARGRRGNRPCVPLGLTQWRNSMAVRQPVGNAPRGAGTAGRPLT